MDTPSSLLERLKLPAEHACWQRFVELYTPLLYYWGRRVGLQESDAADLVQDVFTVLVQKLPEFTYDRDRSFRSWLRTILLNKWRENQRRSGPPPAGNRALADAALPDNVAELGEEEYRQHLAGRMLELLQAEFQPATWRAFWECVAHGRPAAEVAAQLKITVNAVYIAKSRVLGRLRQELAGMLD